MAKNKLCVVGLGYIGLPTACIFADAGFEVLGVDVNPQIISSIQAGKSHLEDEPDIGDVLHRVVQAGRLKAQTKPDVADLYLICVPTPFKGNHEADLTYVESAMNAILPFVQKGAGVVLESTSPPRTTENVIAKALQSKGFKIGQDVFVAYCPERVLPGQILRELKSNTRVVGGMTPACAKTISEYYRKIVDADVIETTATTAETVKLVENSYRDVNIAFANEVSMICSELGISHQDVIKLANNHPRVKILTPGPGVGGHCIAVDPWFLVEACPDNSDLIRTAREVNLRKTRFVIDQIKAAASERFKKTNAFQRIYLFGMTYKPNVADFRESPAIEIYHALAKELGNMAEIHVVDPFLEIEATVKDPHTESLPAAKLKDVPGEGPSVLTVRLVSHKDYSSLKFTYDFSQ